MIQQLPDAELVKGCLEGNTSYQQLLYKQFASRMLTVCMRYTTNRAEAEDILQECFIKVFEKLWQFKGAGSLEGWIRRIAVNKCLEHLRKAAQIFPIVDIEDVGNDFYGREEIVSHIAADDLLRMIQELPPRYRLVFNLYVFEEMPHKEIAKQLGISEGTSKSNLFDAREILKKKIRKNMIVATKSISNERKIY
jgi:RNA polymerase sigma-70 factor, ECF subfamily